MTATALRSKNNSRRLMYFLGISLAVHVAMLVGFSIDYLFGAKHVPQTETTAPGASTAPATSPAQTTSPAQQAGIPLAPTKPKDADAEYQKRQTPLSDQEKRKAETIRPDLDQLK